MKPRCLGDYEIGYESVSLYVRDGPGAEFYRQTKDANCPVIYVGLETASWKEVVTELLHEALELTLDRLHCRLYSSRNLAGDTGAYVFVFDHPQFSACCADVGEFLADALPDLETEWIAWNKKYR